MKECPLLLVKVREDEVWLREERLRVLEHKEATVCIVFLLRQLGLVMRHSLKVELLPAMLHLCEELLVLRVDPLL